MNKGHLMEGEATNAPIFKISMIRCGQQSIEGFSKSKLANDLFLFKFDPNLDSCGFFTKHSLSSNNLRKTANGTVEGMWCDKGRWNDDGFPESFGLLNFRGDPLQYMQTATTLASCSNVVFMFCDVDMFKNDRYEKLLRETAEKLKVKDDGERKIKKLVVVSTKCAQRNINENRILFQDISKTVRLKSLCKNYRKFLESINCTVQEKSH